MNGAATRVCRSNYGWCAFTLLLLLSFSWLPLCAQTEGPKIELAADWKLASAEEARVGGEEVSVAGYEDASWHPIHRMPATVLGILQEDGVYHDLGARKNDLALELRQDSWADMTALNTMPRVDLRVRAVERKTANGRDIAIRLHNPSPHIAFFERATISATSDGGEILPIQYDDNYITVVPCESAEIHGWLPQGAKAGWVKVEGYNTSSTAEPIKE